TAEAYARLKLYTRRLHVRPIDPLTTRLRAAAAVVTGDALTPTALYRRDLMRRILAWHREQPFDAVLTFCTGMIRYARPLTNVRYIPMHATYRPIRHVLDLVDVDSRKWARFADTARPPMKWVYQLEAHRLERVEAGITDWFDAATVVSDAEAATYRQHLGDHARLHVAGNGVDLDYFFPLPDLGKPKIV